MAETIMAMLIASASVEINMVSPFVSFFGCFACSTLQTGFWLRMAWTIFCTGLFVGIEIRNRLEPQGLEDNESPSVESSGNQGS
jgi:hypothetical protein